MDVLGLDKLRDDFIRNVSDEEWGRLVKGNSPMAEKGKEMTKNETWTSDMLRLVGELVPVIRKHLHSYDDVVSWEDIVKDMLTKLNEECERERYYAGNYRLLRETSAPGRDAYVSWMAAQKKIRATLELLGWAGLRDYKMASHRYMIDRGGALHVIPF